MSSKLSLQEKLVKKAWEDSAFKNELLSNPKAAIQNELEIVIPENIEIRVVEETTSTFYIVLPAAPVDIEDTEDTGEIEPQTTGY